jgi:AAA family ATP:ADP antiporter
LWDMQKKLKSYFESFWPEELQERLFIVAAMLCGFFISADYSIVRPVSNSVLLSFFPSTVLPYLWLSALPLNFLLVSLYNRYLPRFGCLKVFACIGSSIFGINLLAALFIGKHEYFSAFHFIWKEIYVLFLFQTIWSLIHMTILPKRAKALYGIMFGVGGLGSVLGSFVPGFFAIEMGSESLLFFSLPILLCLSVCYRFAAKLSKPLQAHESFHKGGAGAAPIGAGVKMIAKSRILPYILLLVIFMQISSTLIDYQFNAYLQEAFPEKDLRTQFLGRMTSVISSSTIAMQFLGTVFFVGVLGLKWTHFMVPCVLFVNAIFSLVWPSLRALAISFGTIKVFDFSLFGITKEMLYGPLSAEEKFQAKSLIDVFSYRGAKAIAAMAILGLQALALTNLSLLTWGCLVIFVLWVISLKKLFGQTEKQPA